MIGQNQVRFVADEDAAGDVDAVPGQLVYLREQRLRVDDDAVTDDAGHARMQDPRGNQPQDELGPVHVDGVAGVVSALVAADDGKMWREEIDDLALAFVSPLRA